MVLQGCWEDVRTWDGALNPRFRSQQGLPLPLPGALAPSGGRRSHCGSTSVTAAPGTGGPLWEPEDQRLGSPAERVAAGGPGSQIPALLSHPGSATLGTDITQAGDTTETPHSRVLFVAFPASRFPEKSRPLSSSASRSLYQLILPSGLYGEC